MRAPGTAMRARIAHAGRIAAMIAATSLALTWPAAPAGAQGDVHVEINQSGLVRVNLTMGDFATGREGLAAIEAAQTTRELVKNDLLFSGLFAPVRDLSEPTPADEKPLQDLLARLKTEGQDAFLTAAVNVSGSTVSLETRLYETGTGHLIERSTRVLVPGDLRATGHALADHLVLLLTGERGIAGTRIAFVSTRTGAKEIYAMDYDGQRVTQLTNNRSINLSPTWSPRGDFIAMVSFLKHDADIYLIRPDHPEMAVLVAQPGLDSAPAFSPRGDRVAFTHASDGNPDIYAGSFHDGRLTDVTRLTQDPGVDCCPTWAPGGNEIAFVSDRSGDPQVFIMQADGTDVRRVTFLGNYNASPAWSPDGSRIAFASRENDDFSIFTVQPSGLALTRLTATGSFETPSWSPDGRYLAVSSNLDGRSGIYVLGADGSGLRRLTFGAGDDTAPSWGPRPPEEAGGTGASGADAAPHTAGGR